MKNIPRYVSFLLLLFISFLLVLNLFLPEQRSWRMNRREMENMRLSMDSARLQMQESLQIIDSLRSELGNYTNSMNALSSKLQSLEKDRKSGQDKFLRESVRLKQKLKELNTLADSSSMPIIIIE